jgi:hypothetical protein
MMAVDDGRRIKFSSGRVLEPYAGVVGLSADGYVYGGYDDQFWDGKPDPWDAPQNLDAADMVELADAMIERWRAFKQRLSDEKT